MRRSLISATGVLLCLTWLTALPAHGQSDLDKFSAADWNGTWVAQGTVFSVAVSVQQGIFQVREAQSLGFVWSSQPGQVEGNRATVEVQYAGVTALVLARLTSKDTAVVEAASCMPEFMVVCTLAKGQQAVFVRTSTE